LLDDSPKSAEQNTPDPTIWTDPLIWEDDGPGDRSCDMVSWIEERAIIDRAFAEVGKGLEECKKWRPEEPAARLENMAGVSAASRDVA
jgi:hypothetical protein